MPPPTTRPQTVETPPWTQSTQSDPRQSLELDPSTDIPDAAMAEILSDIDNLDQNSPQLALILAAQIGQQLLAKNNDLELELNDERATQLSLVSQIEDLKLIVKSEHSLRIEAGLEVLRREETCAALRRSLGKNGDVLGEAENLRARIDHLDTTRSQLDKILKMTNRELKTVVGERHVLQLTVQELYDQLGNFMEINNSLKKSCQKQIQEYKNMMTDMQLEKKQLSECLTDQMKRIENLSSKDSATSLYEKVDSLTTSIKSIMNQEQTSVYAHLQQQNIADMLALQSTLENVEAEKKELLEIISRQQETIKSMEEDVVNLEARLSSHDRGALYRGNGYGISSLKSSLSKVNVILDESKSEMRPHVHEYDGASTDS
ncbi:UNVERIFIED_CONTAM: hypothetical protein HDU68_007228 [Siphonaria sp. JEL0065]|nr:hypothetical protein HDU68_007228 [Siphonaria sp. JEL0065]